MTLNRMIRQPNALEIPDAFPEFRALVDSVKDYAIFVLDPSGRILTWNEGARAIKGYAPEEIIGDNIARFYTPEDRQAGRPVRLLRAAAQDGRVEDEGWRVRRDGTRFWADVVITALRDDAGRLRGFLKVTRDLTERKQTEELLRQNERRVRLLVDSVRDYAIFMLDEHGRITTWNQGAERMKGYRADEVLGKHCSIFYTPEDVHAGRAASHLRDAAEHGRIEIENWRVRRDGTRFWADVILTRVDDDSGQLIGFAEMTRDLTARRLMEEALRRSEERMRIMIESVRGYAIFMLDATRSITSWNAGAQALLGWAPEDAIGSHFSVFYVPEDCGAGKPRRDLDTTSRLGRCETDGWRVRFDGSRVWVNSILSAAKDENGILLGFASVVRDMSERKRIEDERDRRIQQQQAVADMGLLAVETRELQPLLDRATTLVASSLRADFTHVLEVEAGGRTFLFRAGAGWPEGIVGTIRIDVERSLAGAALRSGELLRVDDSAAAPANLADAALMREHGVVSGMAVVIRAPGHNGRSYGVLFAGAKRACAFTAEDANFLQSIANVVAAAIARQHIEEQLHVAEIAAREERIRSMRAREAVRERDEFISVAAHELRTPLSALQLKLEGVEASLKRRAHEGDGGRVVDRLESALRQTHRLGELIERLLDVSRIVAGQFALSCAASDLTAIMARVVEDVREQAVRAGCELHVQAAGPLVGRWDAPRLEQALLNLVTNAIKYGAGKPIEMTMAGSDRSVHVVIKDRGIGISDPDKERIFGRFERAAPIRNYGGMGLGLYITRHIVEAHGGAIAVSSSPGEGSTFVIDIPREVSPASPVDETTGTEA